MFFKRKKKMQKVKKVLYEGIVKRMDVRYGSFIWLKDRYTGKEFYGDLSIERVVITLPPGMLSKKIETRTPAGLIKLRLRHVLEHLGDRETYFKYLNFKRPVHVRIFGVLGGDVEVTFTEGKKKDDGELPEDEIIGDDGEE